MNTLKFVGAVLLVANIFAAGLLFAQEYPHAYPRTGVTKIFENDRVTLWEVHWIHGAQQPIHRHLYDMAGVYLRYGNIHVTTPDGKVMTSEPFDIPRPYFQLRGITHKEEGFGGPADPEMLAVMVDLKEPAPTGAVSTSKMDPAFPREGAVDALDNSRVREWDYTWHSNQDLNKPMPMRVYTRDSVQVFVTGGAIRYTSPDGHEETKTYEMKDARFIPQDTAASEEAANGTPRAITIELK